MNALKKIKAEVLCVGIKSDLLFPTDEQKIIASNTRNAQYVEIDSFYGHDGFLIEKDLVTTVVRDFREKTSKDLKDYRGKIKNRVVRPRVFREGLA
jgi:homoserine O-acetyltransferase